uniref:Uncharacterized protein n=1 Tax=Hanusia phi TaxID=3032 RepID=A0A7S0EUV8_9CRYP|mmetsp:Transcript_31131/g.70063  ORF Transcript_31131/g.70063 Transcript_31131/m.70063 type:complete len:222 (+) Transcript_31131:68-733(+)
MSFPWSDDQVDRQVVVRRPNSKSGAGGCPWAQDNDADEFKRGPPSNRGKRTGISGHSPQYETAGKPLANKSAAGQGPPWAATDADSWAPPANAYGAGVQLPPKGAELHVPYDHSPYYAQPLPDEVDYPEIDYHQPVSRPMDGNKFKGAAPWAQDEGEPMVSVSKSSFAAPKSVYAPPQMHNQASNYIDHAEAQRATAETRLAAKAIRARMQGSGNVLTWAQ